MSPPWFKTPEQRRSKEEKVAINIVLPLTDHMNIEEFVEEDEEPPLLLSSRPPCSTYVHIS